MIGPGRRRARLTLALLALALAAAAHGWFDVRQRARLDRGLRHHHTDLAVYLAAARAVEDGGDPYRAESPRGWRYVYPPLLAILVRPLLRLDVPDAALVFYALSVLALALSVVWIARAVGPPPGGRAAALATLAASPFLLQTLQRGQVTILLLATVAGALALLLRRRDALAGVVLALGGALRLTPFLVAGMVAIGGLRAVRSRGASDALRFPLGLLGGTLLWFVAVPGVLLGPRRAIETTSLWLSRTQEVFGAEPGEAVPLDAVDEFSFKNQGVRRVVAAWTGRERAGPERLAGVDLAAAAVALATLAAAVLLSLRAGRDRADPRWRVVYAIGAFLPVFVTRYAWPTHFVLVVPLLAEATLRRGETPARVAILAFVGGTALFYAGHLAALRALPEAGVLLVGSGVAALAMAATTRRARADPVNPPRSA